MSSRGRFAFANARARAIKSRLSGREMVSRLSRASGVDAMARRRFQDLVAAYGTLIASYPTGAALLLSLLRWHEMENVTLAWRAVVRRLPPDRWTPHWIPLGDLASVDLDALLDSRSLSALVDALARTPYGEIADRMRRAHAEDLPAAELGFDRWASRQSVEETAALGPGEAVARDLVLAAVRERDLNTLRRAHAYALPPDGLIAALACLPEDLGAEALVALGAWTAADGPLWARLPRHWVKAWGRPPDWDALLLACRRARRAACNRAFLGDPFCLGPGVAVLLLHEEEVRGMTAIHEAGNEAARSPAVQRALAAGPSGE
jgi:hypothetical protein